MADFDVQGARKAGYSDDDILQHLTETRKFDVGGAVKAGYSKADIITHLSSAPASVAGKSAVSPGASDDDLIAHFGFDPAVIKSSARYQEAVKKNGSGLSFSLTDPNRKDLIARIADSKAGDVGQGGVDLMKGIVQLARHGANKLGMLSDADVQYGDLLDRLQSEDYQQNVRHGNASGGMRTLGNIVAGAALPGVTAPAGAGVVRQVATTALGGATAAATQPVESGAPGDFWAEKGKQAATGAVVAPVVAGAARLVGTGAAKVLGKARNASAVKLPAQLEAEAAQSDAAAQGTADAANTAARTRATSQVAQAEQRATNVKTGAQNAATSTVEQLKAGMEETAWGSIDDVSHAAESGDEAAKQLLTKLENAGTDPGRIHEASIDLSDFRSRQVATDLYDKVQDLVEKKKLPEVPLTATGDAVKRLIDRAKLSKIQDKGLNSVLKQIQESITPRTVPAKQAAGFVGAPTTPKIYSAKNTYGLLRELDSDLGERIRSKMSGDGALIGDKGVGQLQAMKDALRADLDNFTRKSGVPEIQQAAQQADEFYKNVRVPFKNRMIANAGSGATDSDQIFKSFIQAGKGDRAQRFYDALDPKGQAAVQYSMVAKAMNDASDNLTETFNHGKFFKSMDNLKDAYGVFFQGTDKLKIDGLKKLMQQAAQADESVAAVRSLTDEGVASTKAVTDANVKATAAAGKASVDAANARLSKIKGAPLGTATLAGVGAAEAFGRLGMPVPAVIAGGIAGLAGLTKAFLTTDAGKRYLLAASDLPVGPRLQKLLDTAMAELPAAAARAAAEPPANPLQAAAQRQKDAAAERKAKLLGTSGSR
jgi:hypothetical protein